MLHWKSLCIMKNKIRGITLKTRNKIWMTIFIILALLLTSCSNSSEKASEKTNIDGSNVNPVQENNVAEEENDARIQELENNVEENESTNKSSEQTEDSQKENNNELEINEEVTQKTNDNDTQTEDVIRKKDQANSNLEVEESSSVKDEFLKKLSEAKIIASEMEPTDPSTYAAKHVETKRWELWDNLLNEIYGVLQQQLPKEEMDQLREKQRSWLKLRDESALKRSEKFKGGTLEHLVYTTALADLTEERCYELVRDYMK